MGYLGCHLSSAGGYAAMCKTAAAIGADTFQFFTRNPRGGKAKALDPADAAVLAGEMAAGRLGPVIAHAPYTITPCSKDPRVQEFALNTMADDLSRLELLPGALYNFHPGSHVGQGEEAGIALIAETLNQVLRPEEHTPVLLETMAGKGSEVGGTFESLRAILDRVERSDRMGVCLDTCHVHDAGYDIVGNLDGVLEEFDRVIGLSRLGPRHHSRQVHHGITGHGVGEAGRAAHPHRRRCRQTQGQNARRQPLFHAAAPFPADSIPPRRRKNAAGLDRKRRKGYTDSTKAVKKSSTPANGGPASGGRCEPRPAPGGRNTLELHVPTRFENGSRARRGRRVKPRRLILSGKGAVKTAS